MSNGKGSNTGKSSGGMDKRGGYQPTNEGYQPQSGEKGYSPTQGSGNPTPKPPAGGTGQSSGTGSGKSKS